MAISSLEGGDTKWKLNKDTTSSPSHPLARAPPRSLAVTAIGSHVAVTRIRKAGWMYRVGGASGEDWTDEERVEEEDVGGCGMSLEPSGSTATRSVPEESIKQNNQLK